MELRGADAVADEDGLAVEGVVFLLIFRGADEVLHPLERGFEAVLGSGERGVGAGGDADERNGLKEGALIAGRLEAVEGELRGDIFGGQFTAANADAAPLQQVIRKKLDVRADAFTGDGGRLRQQDSRGEAKQEWTFHGEPDYCIATRGRRAFRLDWSHGFGFGLGA